MHPVLLRRPSSQIDDLRNQIVAGASQLGGRLHPLLRTELSDYMLLVNSYYTNAMEGNPSKLRDIEKALRREFLPDPVQRDFQLEHLAHIEVQKEMLRRLDSEPELDICAPEFLSWLHERFYQRLPEGMRFAMTESGKKVAIIPGGIRDRGVTVGAHEAPEGGEEIKSFLMQFQKGLSPSLLNAGDRFVAFASSHHRLLWIHPFSDGNGRVARLFSSAYATRIGVAADSLWNVSRAFARNRTAYDRELALADRPRRNDSDGRGPLSEEALEAFCLFFFRCCIDQIEFMKRHLDPAAMQKSLHRFLLVEREEKKLSSSVCELFRKVLMMGEVPRSEVQSICGVKARRASIIIKEALDTGMLTSPSAYGPLRLRIDSKLASVLLPELV